MLSTFHKIPATNSMNCYWILFINVFIYIPVPQHSATSTLTYSYPVTTYQTLAKCQSDLQTVLLTYKLHQCTTYTSVMPNSENKNHTGIIWTNICTNFFHRHTIWNYFTLTNSVIYKDTWNKTCCILHLPEGRLTSVVGSFLRESYVQGGYCMTGEGLMNCEHPQQKLSKYGHGRVGSTTVGLQHTRGTHLRGGVFLWAG